MEGLCLNLPLLLQTIHNIFVSPTNLVRETLHCAIFPAGFQSQNTECLRHNHALLSIIGRRDTFKEFEAFKGCCTSSSLVGSHAANGSVEDLGWCAVVEGPGLFGVDDMPFMKEIMVPQLVAEEAARDVNLLASNDDNFLAVEGLLRND